MNSSKIVILVLTINVYFILTSSLATSNQDYQRSIQMKIETLPLQKSYVIEVHPGITKKLEINIQQIKKYIAHGNEHKIIKSFKLQYDNILRVAEIYISVFFNKTRSNQGKPFVFDLNKDLSLIQSTVFDLDFLGKFSFEEIQKIQLDIRSGTFSVLELTLMNNEIANQIDIYHLSEEGQGFGTIYVWMPQSNDSQIEKYKQVTKYLYFKASQNPTKLKITRIKGHPKIFLYNCESNKISFCRQQIEEQHIEGTLMFQKQLQITLQKEPKCKNCSIIIAFKNMGVQTKIQITQHKIHNSIILSKDNPTYYTLKAKQTLQISSYFNLPEKIETNPYFFDISVIQGDSKMLNIDFVSLQSITIQTQNDKKQNVQIYEFSSFFTIENQSTAIKIKINSAKDLSKYLIVKDSNNQTWYKINIIFTTQRMIDFTVIDRNIPQGQENFITLKDGQILNSYVFSQTKSKQDESKSSEFFSQNFKVKVSSISVLTVSSLCSEINKMAIKYFTQSNIHSNHSQKTTKINPKIFVENITHFNKKCSQLIHLNPVQLFAHEKNDNITPQKSGWVYFKISGVKTQVDLLYSSSDIITLEKSFPYHSQLQYNQELYFHVPNVQNQAIIKIRKCSDCQTALSFSQEQLADIKSIRSHQIIQKEVKSINNIYKYQMKDQNGLFIKVKTNNFAHFAITIQDITQEESQQLSQFQLPQINNKISFSLEKNNTLTLEFHTPTFLYTNNLNSPTYYSLIEGSINVQVSRETYCPQFIFSERQRTRDVTISQIMPQLINDDQGNQKLTFSIQVKHHDFFGIRAQKGDQIFSYKVVNMESMKTYSTYRWSFFQVALFLTFAVFMSFVCFMGLKKNRIKKVGGQVIMQSQDGEQTSMVRLN